MEENGRISKFVFDGKNVVAEETDEDVIWYIRGDRLVASDSEHARTYYHYVGDELGSIIHVIQGEEKGYFDKEESESQKRIQSEDRILNRYAYDAFGNRTVCEEKIANRFGYAGEMYDGITQQYYLRARFYNPIIGRFTQEDTYYGDGLNLYEYGRNNPVRYIDPSGHEVRAAAEKNYVNRAVVAMNKAADQGVNGMLERVYGDTGSSSTKSPSEMAQSWQGSGKYPGVDTYKDITLKEGKVIYRGEPNGSEYFTTKSAIERSGRDATRIFEGLQVEKNPIHGYRGNMQGYKATIDIEAAFGITRANPQFGKGGLPQVFVPDAEMLIKQGILESMDSIPLIR